ncbi:MULTISPECIES: hypothetical protein [Oscillatoriales]|nr:MULTISPECIES: hypothetical protein [Oscillatoriales]EDZ94879.1 hypothetical protein AmaxDRAFT_2285 [Limnospira maxima CS-328]EKD06201.1 hypothetical protein SPLC1_S541460 [Arthrospira platensis C1]MBD2710253.1 hypothetical protein [Arthrospira platensis FACHB-835]MDC0840460.1 hypothetical protein [Limnoraphis robusta]MDT9199837.1 hypothetical protein [Limnospira sp. PMC 1042.18]MDT9218656.1 hypothetical protein [Limnospira sp. PMC 1240.20]MDT9264569.1 hypothetical protein [Limnospira sp. 
MAKKVLVGKYLSANLTRSPGKLTPGLLMPKTTRKSYNNNVIRQRGLNILKFFQLKKTDIIKEILAGAKRPAQDATAVNSTC